MISIQGRDNPYKKRFFIDFFNLFSLFESNNKSSNQFAGPLGINVFLLLFLPLYSYSKIYQERFIADFQDCFENSNSYYL